MNLNQLISADSPVTKLSLLIYYGQKHSRLVELCWHLPQKIVIKIKISLHLLITK